MCRWISLRSVLFSIAVVTCLCAGCGKLGQMRTRQSPMELGGDQLRVPAAVQKETVRWLESWEQASNEATRDGKLVLADFTGSDWCGWCKKLDRDVFSTAEFASWAAEHVVLLKVDFPRNSPQDPQIRQQNEMLAKRYAQDVQGYPTVLFLRPDGTVNGSIGYVPGGPEAWIKAATARFQTSP